MFIGHKIFVRFVLSACLTAAVISSAKHLAASFSVPETTIHVEIEGYSFGEFDSIDGIEQTLATPSQDYGKIVFKRDFVTSPSLYLWAKNNVNQRLGLQDIHILEKTKSGETVKTTVLRACHPLSWSVEAANSSIGGFSEAVEMAVQKIER